MERRDGQYKVKGESVYLLLIQFFLFLGIFQLNIYYKALYNCTVVMMVFLVPWVFLSAQRKLRCPFDRLLCIFARERDCQ